MKPSDVGDAADLLAMIDRADTKGVSRLEAQEALGLSASAVKDLARRAVASDRAYLAAGRLYSTAPF